MPEGDTEMAVAGLGPFTKTHVLDDDHVGLVFDKAQTEEILYLGQVDFPGPTPVELIECLEYLKSGESHPSLDTGFGFPRFGGYIYDVGIEGEMRWNRKELRRTRKRFGNRWSNWLQQVGDRWNSRENLVVRMGRFTPG